MNGNGKGERVLAIGLAYLADYRGLSRSARRVLDLCVELADEEGVVRITRRGLIHALSVGAHSIDRAVKDLQRKDFLAQVGYGRLAVNREKMWVFARDRASAGIAVAKYAALREGFAPTLARKQAAGRASWMKRQAAKGGTDVVEPDNEAPPY
jgi:hypothetical protein